ncbi:MAG: hypothetical protein H7834_16280 [Magnetococcus sp. YQC-9]
MSDLSQLSQLSQQKNNEVCKHKSAQVSGFSFSDLTETVPDSPNDELHSLAGHPSNDPEVIEKSADPADDWRAGFTGGCGSIHGLVAACHRCGVDSTRTVRNQR